MLSDEIDNKNSQLTSLNSQLNSQLDKLDFDTNYRDNLNGELSDLNIRIPSQ